jgi:hypothetical protein
MAIQATLRQLAAAVRLVSAVPGTTEDEPIILRSDAGNLVTALADGSGWRIAPTGVVELEAEAN